MKLTDVFNIKIIAERDGLIGGVAVRLLGVDFAFLVTLDVKYWSLVLLTVARPEYNVIVSLEVIPFIAFIGRNDGLYD